MKTPAFVISLGLALAVGTAAAQNAPPLQRTVTPKPLSARPSGLASVSTAESGALHSRVPLRRLPAFQATQIDGKSSDIGAFKQTKHWLLLYRRENCAPCDRMLQTLASSENTVLKTGTSLVILVADQGNKSNGNRLDALRARFSTLSAAAWLEDSQGAALGALKPRGAPMLYALSGESIMWSMPGLPEEQATVEKRASAWLNSEDTQTSHPLQAAASFTASQP